MNIKNLTSIEEINNFIQGNQAKNQLYFKTLDPTLRKARKWIEVLFSQMYDQFIIR